MSAPGTPGPWTFEMAKTADGTTYQHVRAGPVGVADTWHSDPIVILGWSPLAGATERRHGNPADARLIAAAPDLYDALDALVDAQCPSGEDATSENIFALTTALGKADAALKKARGE